MRQIVACVTCATKDWIDDFYPCFAWTEAPPAAVVGAAEHDNEDDLGDAEKDAEEAIPHRRTYGPQLRDENGFCYFGPADKIHALLNIDNYRHFVPLAKLEELHASSVQHPRFPEMRWLLNTQRVPVLPPDSLLEHAESSEGAAADARPTCAGIGNAEEPC